MDKLKLSILSFLAILTMISFLLLLPTVYADEQLAIGCTGDPELTIGCNMGDAQLGNFFLGGAVGIISAIFTQIKGLLVEIYILFAVLGISCLIGGVIGVAYSKIKS